MSQELALLAPQPHKQTPGGYVLVTTLRIHHASYVDGDHTSEGAFLDGLLSWDLLRPGGVLIFDDYDGFGVALGVDTFLETRRSAGNLHVLWASNQLIVQKLHSSDGGARSPSGLSSGVKSTIEAMIWD